MEKLILVLRRASSRDRDGFGRHFINHHARLAVRRYRDLKGYSVNLTQSSGGPDAVAELWVPHVATFVVSPNFRGTEDQVAEFLADERGLFASIEMHVVEEELELTSGMPSVVDAPKPTPERKLISFFGPVGEIPEAPVGARRVVDNIISHKYAIDGGRLERAKSQFDVVRMVWSARALALPQANARSVEEYCFLRL